METLSSSAATPHSEYIEAFSQDIRSSSEIYLQSLSPPTPKPWKAARSSTYQTLQTTFVICFVPSVGFASAYLSLESIHLLPPLYPQRPPDFPLSTSPSLVFLNCELIPTCVPRFPIIAGERIEFAELAALVRMSHKYHVEDLHSRSMHHLKSYFTNDLSTWDSAGADGNVSLHITPPDAIAAVNLARLTHTNSVLPTALYLCCQLDQELNLGVERPDGSVERLEPRDLELVLRGRTELVRASTRGACTICKPISSAQCHHSGGSSKGGQGGQGGCERALREILGMMLDGLQKDPIGDIAGFAALDSWEHWIEDVVELWPLCEPCRAMLHARDLDVRKDVWRNLPGYMGVVVEDWKDPTAPAAPATPGATSTL